MSDYGLWIVLFRMDVYDLWAMENEDEKVAVYISRQAAAEAVEGHILEDCALLVNVTAHGEFP